MPWIKQPTMSTGYTCEDASGRQFHLANRLLGSHYFSFRGDEPTITALKQVWESYSGTPGYVACESPESKRYFCLSTSSDEIKRKYMNLLNQYNLLDGIYEEACLFLGLRKLESDVLKEILSLVVDCDGEDIEENIKQAMDQAVAAQHDNYNEPIFQLANWFHSHGYVTEARFLYSEIPQSSAYYLEAQEQVVATALAEEPAETAFLTAFNAKNPVCNQLAAEMLGEGLSSGEWPDMVECPADALLYFIQKQVALAKENQALRSELNRHFATDSSSASTYKAEPTIDQQSRFFSTSIEKQTKVTKLSQEAPW